MISLIVGCYGWIEELRRRSLVLSVDGPWRCLWVADGCRLLLMYWRAWWWWWWWWWWWRRWQHLVVGQHEQTSPRDGYTQTNTLGLRLAYLFISLFLFISNKPRSIYHTGCMLYGPWFIRNIKKYTGNHVMPQQFWLAILAQVQTFCGRNIFWGVKNKIFTGRCTIVLNAILRLHVIRPSVCLTVTLVDQDHIGWKSSPTTPSLFVVQRPYTYTQENMGKTLSVISDNFAT